MELYFIRHALAELLGKRNDFTDEKRALTDEGGARMREIAKGLKRLGIEVDLILSSPLVRAVDTAEIVAAGLGLTKKDITQTAGLSPGASFYELFAEIKRHQGAESIALVGHQPDLGRLASRIISCGDQGAIQLKKGGVCCVTVAETVPSLRGELVWLLTPRQLRLLARK